MTKKTPVGRPSEYTPEIVKKAWEYAEGGWEEVGDPVPSIAGLACEIGIRRETCHAWAKDESKEFSNILGLIAEKQEQQLLRGGLLGAFNASITKMMMTKHGYSDKIDSELSGPDGGPIVQKIERVIVDPKES